MSLGAAIRERRQVLYMPQGELAERAGVSQSWLSRLESDREFEVGYDKLMRVAGILMLSPEELAEAAGYASAPAVYRQEITDGLALYSRLNREDQEYCAVIFLRTVRATVNEAKRLRRAKTP